MLSAAFSFSFHADCMEIMKQYPDKYFDLAIVDKINMILLLLYKSEIARTLNIGIATVHRYLSEGWKPFETKARYFSDFIRNKEWFYGI